MAADGRRYRERRGGWEESEGQGAWGSRGHWEESGSPAFSGTPAMEGGGQEVP